MFETYQGKSRDSNDPLSILEELIKLVQNDDDNIECLNKLLPKEYRIPRI